MRAPWCCVRVITMGSSARPMPVIKAEAVWRRVLLHTAVRAFPSFIVTEFPKSGGTWLCQMLSESLDMPYPRNRFPRVGSNIYQGHYLAFYPAATTLVQWRDPRDVLVSLYHYLYFETDFVSAASVAKTRAEAGFADFEDVRANLPSFIERTFTHPTGLRFSWNDFFDAWYPARGVTHTSYERLQIDPVTELARVVTALGKTPDRDQIVKTVDRFSFEKLSGRKEGEENRNSFMRKGIVGDWKNVFSPEATTMLDKMTAGRLETYETFMASLPPLQVADEARP